MIALHVVPYMPLLHGYQGLGQAYNDLDLPRRMFPGFAILFDALEADIVDHRRKFSVGVLPSPSGRAV